MVSERPLMRFNSISITVWLWLASAFAHFREGTDAVRRYGPATKVAIRHTSEILHALDLLTPALSECCGRNRENREGED
jgi:hypothetical protein